MTAFTWEDFESTVVLFSTLRPIISCSKSSTPHQFVLGKIAVERVIFVKKDINTEENLISSPNHFWTHQPIQQHNQPTRWNFLESFYLLLQQSIQLQSLIAHHPEFAYATKSQTTVTTAALLETWPEAAWGHHCDEKLVTCKSIVAELMLIGLNSILIHSIHTLNNTLLFDLDFQQQLPIKNFKTWFLACPMMNGICFSVRLAIKFSIG